MSDCASPEAAGKPGQTDVASHKAFGKMVPSRKG